MTVEPGIYIGADRTDVDPQYRGIGVRIEDDVLVTPDGHEVLSAAVPKQPEEIEDAAESGSPGSSPLSRWYAGLGTFHADC